MKKYILTLLITYCYTPAYALDPVSYSIATTAKAQVNDLSNKLDVRTDRLNSLVEKLTKQVVALEQQNKSLEERVLDLESKSQPKTMKKNSNSK